MYRVANNCGQHSLDKNSYFIPSFSCFTSMIGSMKGLWIFWVKYQKDEHCIFILLIFIKGANISGGHCSFTYSQPLICRSPGLSLALSSLFCLSKTCLLLTSFCNIGSLLCHYWHILSLSLFLPWSRMYIIDGCRSFGCSVSAAVFLIQRCSDSRAHAELHPTIT